MSPRPRLASDADILAGALRAITRLGPARLTLADVAGEVGLSPAALVQRFGSKRGLLLAVASQGPDGNREQFAAIRAAHRSPTAALLAMADCMAQLGATPAEISNSLAFLQIDLTDPDFHRYALASAGQMHREIAGLVAEGVRAGELVRCDAERVARALEAAMSGSLLTWAIHRQGRLPDWIRRDLETILRPYRTARRGRPPAKRRRRLRSKSGR